MLIVKLLSIIVILCSIILMVQLMQLNIMGNKDDNENKEEFTLETFDEEDNEDDGDIIGNIKKNPYIENVTRDLHEIELSTNNMLLKIQSIKNKMNANKEQSIQLEDSVSNRMDEIQKVPSVSEEHYEDEDDKDKDKDKDVLDEDDQVEGFVDGLSHNCGEYSPKV